MQLALHYIPQQQNAIINLPTSKSESNRFLILQALSKNSFQIKKLSTANDTLLLQKALNSTETLVDIDDAGTAMRFLTAFFCVKNEKKILTGSERMQERPIAELVNALNAIGFNISYQKNEGFPPLQFSPVTLDTIKNEVTIRGDISSQYISALILIAPFLKNGLTINFTTALVSKPYVELTLMALSQIGITADFAENKITISPQKSLATDVVINADWSAASYFFSLAAMIDKPNFILENINSNSHQGDKKIADWIVDFGVICKEKNGTISFEKTIAKKQKIHFDFTHQPDLAQTIIVLCAATNTNATFSGLASLKIKETNRVLALQNELKKCGIDLTSSDEINYTLSGDFFVKKHTIFNTYNDHRMAMAFAPLAIFNDIFIDNPSVVKKSFPHFWDEIAKIGISAKAL